MEYLPNKTDLDINYPPTPIGASKWTKLLLSLHRFIMVSPSHPTTVEFFKSEVAILKENERHYTQFKHTIHPLSKFNQLYEVWCFFFYGILLFFKTYDFAFVRIGIYNQFELDRELLIISTFLDLLSLCNVVLQFFIGFTVQGVKYVELSKSKIALRYLNNGHFICDLFSSIPRILTWRSHAIIFSVVLCLTLLKLRRITTFMKLIKPTAVFFGIKSNTNFFLLGFFCLISLIMHVMTCFHFGVPRFRLATTLTPLNQSYLTGYFLTLNPTRQYLVTFFKSAQYTFLIDIPHLRRHSVSEELSFSLINYILGKLLLAVIWIVLLYTFLSQRMLRVKFEEVMTELNEYMIAKQLPPDLKQRLICYYRFKYRNVFFNETFIRTILSENLKKEIDVYLCKSLIKHVSIFSQISSKTVKQIVASLIPEIYLPNDLIIQSASYGDCMYFIECGTVAVLAPSGREICHLNDGAYFGEISVLMKDHKRTASIIAIETTRIFKLNKEDFEKCFRRNDPVYNIILDLAKRRIEETSQIETDYKQMLFEQTYTRKSYIPRHPA